MPIGSIGYCNVLVTVVESANDVVCSTEPGDCDEYC
mgnify:CR=1 FL=1